MFDDDPVLDVEPVEAAFALPLLVALEVHVVGRAVGIWTLALGRVRGQRGGRCGEGESRRERDEDAYMEHSCPAALMVSRDPPSADRSPMPHAAREPYPLGRTGGTTSGCNSRSSRARRCLGRYSLRRWHCIRRAEGPRRVAEHARSSAELLDRLGSMGVRAACCGISLPRILVGWRHWRAERCQEPRRRLRERGRRRAY